MPELHRSNAWLLACTSFALWVLGCGGAKVETHDSKSPQQDGGALDAGAGSGENVGAEETARAGDDFETPDPLSRLGLWMGLGDSLPVEQPPIAHDGNALHLVGDSGNGFDFMFHTPLPVERMCSVIQVWALSDLPGAALTIAVAGPRVEAESQFFKDRAAGNAWPAHSVMLAPSWQRIDLPLSSLGLDEQHLGPYESPFGAVHFIIEPNTHYDFWLDDLNLTR